VAPPVKVFTYTYADLERLSGMTKTGVSQAVSRGILMPDDLLSVCAFLGRYGTPDVRLELMSRMIGVDRQTAERSRVQSTPGVGRTQDGRLEASTLVADGSGSYAIRTLDKSVETPKDPKPQKKCDKKR
jgi:hypothetical protein